MNTYCLFSILCLARHSEAFVLRGQSSSQSLTSDASVSEMESEDRSFLLSQLEETESQLVKLQEYAVNITASVEKNATVDKGANKTVSVPKIDKAKAGTKVAAVDPAKIMASLGGAGLKGSIALAPMLAMLKGMYADSKDRIAQVNTREDKSKKWFTEKEAEHAKRMADIESHFKKNHLSEELHANETRDETRYFNYWSKVRERQHRQFHTNLKIQHAMMAKSKKMIDMYEMALSPKAADQEKVKKELGQSGMPEIVFLQDTQHVVVEFCQESLAQLRTAQSEMSQENLE